MLDHFQWTNRFVTTPQRGWLARRRLKRWMITLLGLLFVILMQAWRPRLSTAHQVNQASVHDVVSEVREKLRQMMTEQRSIELTHELVLATLNDQQRRVLSEGHIHFRVSHPARIYLMRDSQQSKAPFWLEQQGFEPTSHTFKEGRWSLDVWQKTVEPGWVKLGVSSLIGGSIHYLLAVEPLDNRDELRIAHLTPASLRVVDAQAPLRPYVDHHYQMSRLPEFLRNKLFVQTIYARRNDGRLLGLFRRTKRVSQSRPDQVVLTWSGDPTTTQTIQWRTQATLKEGWVRYNEKRLLGKTKTDNATCQRAERALIESPTVVNDTRNARYTATLTDLMPGTEYLYTVGTCADATCVDTFCAGDGAEANQHSEPATFRTAPKQIQPFSFVYMGDAQNGLQRWGELITSANERNPEAAFYLMAGDLVDRGNDRDDWDDFFYYARSVFNRKPLVPVIGNHEVQGGAPTLYLQLFSLPTNGPRSVTPERAYHFQYGNALFVILDSTLPPTSQQAWLDKTLAASSAVWKFVAYHHPLYPSSDRPSPTEFKKAWIPLFDKYRVDFALQGHDHAYLRTYPMRGDKKREPGTHGTIYLVSVSGTKMYPQVNHSYIEKGFAEISTYQVFSLSIDNHRLHYRAYDLAGQLQDTVVIEKP